MSQAIHDQWSGMGSSDKTGAISLASSDPYQTSSASRNAIYQNLCGVCNGTCKFTDNVAVLLALFNWRFFGSQCSDGLNPASPGMIEMKETNT